MFGFEWLKRFRVHPKRRAAAKVRQQADRFLKKHDIRIHHYVKSSKGEVMETDGV